MIKRNKLFTLRNSFQDALNGYNVRLSEVSDTRWAFCETLKIISHKESMAKSVGLISFLCLGKTTAKPVMTISCLPDCILYITDLQDITSLTNLPTFF